MPTIIGAPHRQISSFPSIAVANLNNKNKFRIAIVKIGQVKEVGEWERYTR